MSSTNKIYLDHSATTPVDKKVLSAMLPYFGKKFGNASSLHSFGQEAIAGVDEAREELARFLNCSGEEIVFTSGATEANNLAIRGFIKALKKRTAQSLTEITPRHHVITSTIEHDSILENFKDLESSGIEVSYAPVKANGVIDLEKFKALIKENTVLVSIICASNEVGAIQPIREIGNIIRKVNEERMFERHAATSQSRLETATRQLSPIYFHTDATQALNYLACDIKAMGVDMLSLSGHKIYAAKGVGALYARAGIPLSALQLGGHHENNKRSGTLNVPAIVGLGTAISELTEKNVEKNNKKIARLRDLLVEGIIKKIPDVILNTDRSVSTASHAHFTFLGVEGESILISLDLEGVAVSTGSACASKSLEPSHVLLAMGIKKEIAHSSIRFTLGKYTIEEEIKSVLKILPPVIARLRKMTPVKYK
jgi:cysteine desulfurase